MFPCVFLKLSDGSLESNTLSIASLDLASQGSLCLFLQGCALAHPSSLPWFLGSQALLPLAGSRCVSSGLREVPPGEVPRSLFWCHSTVKALHLPPFQGGPMGPAVTLADHSTLKNLHQRQGLCSALDAHDHYGGLLTHFTEKLGFEPGVRGLGAQGPYPLTRPFHVRAGVFLGKGLGAHWEMGLTSGPTARMTKAARPRLPLPHPPQPPEPCRGTRGWLEHRSRGRREAFTAPDCRTRVTMSLSQPLVLSA